MTWIEYIKQSDQHALAALFSIGNMISTVMEPCTKWSIKRYVRELGDPASLDDMIHKLDQAQEYMNAHSDEISNDVVYHGLLHFVIIMNKQISENDLHHMDDMVEKLKNGPGLGSHNQDDPDNRYHNLFSKEAMEEEDLLGFQPATSEVQVSPGKIGVDIANLLRGRKIDE